MVHPAIVLAVFLVGLAALLWWGRRLPGPARLRPALLALAVLFLVVGFGAWAVPRYGPGAMLSATVLTLVVIPVVWSLWKEATLRRNKARSS